MDTETMTTTTSIYTADKIGWNLNCAMLSSFLFNEQFVSVIRLEIRI